MIGNTLIQWALMRDVSDSLNACQHEFQNPCQIDVEKARWQLHQYRLSLETSGVSVELLPCDQRYPDCCFVEDSAVVIDDTAIIGRSRAASRQGEVDAVRDWFVHKGFQVAEMSAPAHLDGGDVLQIDDNIYVGISRRTNREGFEMIAGIAHQRGRRSFAIEVRGALHLKSACTYLGRQTIIGSLDLLGDGRHHLERFQTYPADLEPQAANVSLVNGRVYISAQCVNTIDRLTSDGFDLVPVDISELQKAEAGLTCLTILGP